MLEVYDNQDAIELKTELLTRLEKAGNAALALALNSPAHGGGVLPNLELVEVSIVDDSTIERVHQDFMDIGGATDVITFAHGEIVVSVETAKSNAAVYGHSMECELMLYIVHGLLHLSGHEDSIEHERATMEIEQTCILEQVWSEVE